jgi:hypothetical protein
MSLRMQRILLVVAPRCVTAGYAVQQELKHVITTITAATHITAPTFSKTELGNDVCISMLVAVHIPWQLNGDVDTPAPVSYTLV